MALDKLVDSSELNASLTSIADAIRSKAGTSSMLTFPSGMVSAINSIPSGGDTDVEDEIIQRNISGKYVNNRVTAIGTYAFYSCSSLQSVSFPTCKTISNSAFYTCPSLQTASFPVCTIIGQQAFAYCYSLQTVSFPVCTSIGGSAFYKCYHLLSLYLLGSSVPTLSNINAFSSTPISNYTASTGGVYGSIIVKESMLDAFKAAANWSAFSARFSVWNEID